MFSVLESHELSLRVPICMRSGHIESPLLKSHHDKTDVVSNAPQKRDCVGRSPDACPHLPSVSAKSQIWASFAIKIRQSSNCSEDCATLTLYPPAY